MYSSKMAVNAVVKIQSLFKWIWGTRCLVSAWERASKLVDYSPGEP